MADQRDEVTEIIAEIGSNHGGDTGHAQLLVDAAAGAGADTVKFQHYPDTRYGPHPLTPQQLRALCDYTHGRKLGFLCSVFDSKTLGEYVRECEPQTVKIASPELTDHALLRECAGYGLRIILSTGMSTTSQILQALEVIYNEADTKVTLLHCLSSYPAPPDELNLKAMLQLGSYGDYGLSDHTLDPVVAPVAAVALGACVVEKHFTLDRGHEGPDHSYAVDPDGFRLMVDAVRMTEQVLGDGLKRVMPSEDATDRRTREWRT